MRKQLLEIDGCAWRLFTADGGLAIAEARAIEDKGNLKEKGEAKEYLKILFVQLCEQ
uniref:Uncharacterized protein n=1 Tax=Kalanchoe fedtschenkoi TaxID=63787 RepID=A0A7N0VH42_KALFE